MARENKSKIQFWLKKNNHFSSHPKNKILVLTEVKALVICEP